MTAPVDIVNRALSEIAARALVADLTENTPQGTQARLWYTPSRQQLLRTAPWGFARKTLALTQLGLIADVPPGSPYPFLVKYAYPSDCQKMRYILPPPVAAVSAGSVAPNVSSAFVYPWCPPSRQYRFLISNDDTVVPSRRVILSNVPGAIAVYTKDEEDPDVFDSLFTDALQATLSNRFVMPLTGNVSMKSAYAQLAQSAIVQARVADGNESIPSSDIRVDWIETRMVGGGYGWGPDFGGGASGWGQWMCSYDNMNWSM